MKYERKFVNISAFRRAALLSVSRRDTARSVALLRGRKDALLSDAECKIFKYKSLIISVYASNYWGQILCRGTEEGRKIYKHLQMKLPSKNKIYKHLQRRFSSSLYIFVILRKIEAFSISKSDCRKRVTFTFQYKSYSTDRFILAGSHAGEATEVF